MRCGKKEQFISYSKGKKENQLGNTLNLRFFYGDNEVNE
jgi:hypothetical protein